MTVPTRDVGATIKEGDGSGAPPLSAWRVEKTHECRLT